MTLGIMLIALGMLVFGYGLWGMPSRDEGRRTGGRAAHELRLRTADEALVFFYGPGGSAPALSLSPRPGGGQILRADGTMIAVLRAERPLTLGDITLHERAGAQRPSKTGGRFSMKATTPS